MLLPQQGLSEKPTKLWIFEVYRIFDWPSASSVLCLFKKNLIEPDKIIRLVGTVGSVQCDLGGSHGDCCPLTR